MIPSTVWGLAFFGVLVAPGLLFDLLMHQHRARASTSPFREASWVVLTSLVFSGAAVAALYGLAESKVVPGLLRPEDLSGSERSLVFSRFGELLFSSTLLLATSCALAWASYLVMRPTGARLIQEPAWVKAFRTDNPVNAAPLVRVKLRSGSVILGTVAEYSVAYERQDRELTLAPPLYSRGAEGQLKELPAVWQRLVIAGADIESIAVAYGEGAAWDALGL